MRFRVFLYRVRLFCERCVNFWRKPIESQWELIDTRLVLFDEVMQNGVRYAHRYRISGNQITLCCIEEMLRKSPKVSNLQIKILSTEKDVDILFGNQSETVNSATAMNYLIERAFGGKYKKGDKDSEVE
ncbi:hypothetical protein F4X90_20375 [Candidatus Poribacteria bacterium]|nr:hypothetical protein [Candidatus Poribacteria bacterium]